MCINTQQQTFLESCVRDCKIFIDTSSLLEESSTEFFKNIAPILKREGKTIFVPWSVKRELEKLADNPVYCRSRHPDNPNCNQRAIAACKLVERLTAAHIVELYGDSDDGDFADNVFLATFTKLRLRENLLLITQDRKLASAILKLGNDTAAVRYVKRILAQRLDEKGCLQRVFAKPKFDLGKFIKPKEFMSSIFEKTVYHTPFGDFNFV